jgi:hypothetical protein
LPVTPTNEFEIAVEEGQFDLVVARTPSGLSSEARRFTDGEASEARTQ